MKKIINILGILVGIITCILIICTMLTSYQFVYVALIFNSYLPIQIGVATTMAMLAIRFLLFEKGRKRRIYFFFSIIFCIGVLYSITVVK